MWGSRSNTPEPNQRAPQKKALCVGLNYPRQKQFKLYGCINDCLNWEHVLKTTFGFDETRVLIDQHPDGQLATAETQIPNRNNILAQLSWLCTTAAPGDVLVFVFSGHGCQVRNSNGEVDQALVPEDFGVLDEHGNPPLVMDDEIHALFQLLPAGVFLTVVLDCCHASRMLDVDHAFDASQRPAKVVQTCEKPREMSHCTADAWQKMYIHRASARPRFIPTVATTGPPRKRRTPPGTGAHVGQMNLNPGVTAFSFVASRPFESCLDANIKDHQQGVMSFCLLEALAQEHRITYEKWLDRASAKLDDIRKTYMPEMDQHIQLSFCPNSAPAEVVVLDPAYAPVAQHRLYQRAKLADSKQSTEGLANAQSYDLQERRPNREASSDFVPSPVYADLGYGRPVQNGANGHPPVAAYLYIRIRCAHQLKNGGSGFFGGEAATPYVLVKVGQQQKRTPEIKNELNPAWYSENEFAFSIFEQDRVLELAVMTVNRFKDECLGRTLVDLPNLPPGPWHTRCDNLRDGSGQLEYDVRIDRSPAGVNHAPQPEQGVPHQPAAMPLPEQAMAPTSQRDLQLGCANPVADPLLGSAAAMSSPAAGQPNLFGTPNLFGNVPNLLASLGQQPGVPLPQPVAGPQSALGQQQPVPQQGLLQPNAGTGAMPALGAVGTGMQGTLAAPGRPLSVQGGAMPGRPLSVQGPSAAAALGGAAVATPIMTTRAVQQPSLYGASASTATTAMPSYTGYVAPAQVSATAYAGGSPPTIATTTYGGAAAITAAYTYAGATTSPYLQTGGRMY